MLYFTIWSIGIAKYDGQFAYVYAKRGQVRRYCSSSQQSSTYRSVPPSFMYVYLSLLPSCMSICRSEQILLTEQWAKQYSGMVKVVSCHPGE